MSSGPDRPARRRGYSFETLLRARPDAPPPPPPPPPNRRVHEPKRRGPDGERSRAKVYLVLALGVAVLAAVAVLVLLSQGEPNDRDEFDLSIPTLPADTCSAEQFISFLGESSGGELTARGEAVCSGNYAAVPTQRASAGGTGSLVSAFRSGPEALWEHFATLDAAECPDLVVIDPGFPAEICTQLR